MRQNVVLKVVADADSNHSYYTAFCHSKSLCRKAHFITYQQPIENLEQSRITEFTVVDQNAMMRDEQRGKMALDKNFDDIFLSSFHIALLRKTRGYSFESSLLSKTQFSLRYHRL